MLATKNSIRGSQSWLVSICCFVTMVFGCGKGDYEAAMQSRVTDLAFESKFIEGLQPDATEVIKDVAELRLPSYIDDRATTLTKTSKTRRQVAISRNRIQPPGIDIPGFRYSYERFVDMGGRNNTQPLYAYFASVPATQSLKSVQNKILSGARAISRNAGWTAENLDTPERQKIAFQKLSVKGVQDFDMDPGGGDTQKKEGQLDFYIHSTKEHHVIVGFRCPNEVDTKENVFAVVPFAMGTLQVQEPIDDEA